MIIIKKMRIPKVNNLFLMKLHIIMFGILIEAGLQIECQTSPTPAPSHIKKSNTIFIMEVMILGFISISASTCFLVIIYKYFRNRHVHEISTHYNTHPIPPVPYMKKNEEVIHEPQYRKPSAIQKFSYAERDYGNSLTNNMNYNNNNSFGEKNKLETELNFNDKLQILNDSIQTIEYDNNSDNLTIRGSHCIVQLLSDHNWDGQCDHQILLFSLNNNTQSEAKKDRNSSPHLFLLNFPRNLLQNTPAELYIDKLIITGQGTIGLKFQAKKRFRIVLNSNKNQSYGSDVIVLDVGDDVTYFRKRNNDNPDDILTSTKEQRALLDKDMEQLYWISIDKKNRRLRYGKGPMQNLLTILCYNFPQNNYEWIKDLRYIAISSITFQKKDFIESKPKVELMFCNLPVTTDLPPFIIKHEDATLEELEAGKATVIDNLPEECKDLYWNIVGAKISLNSSDFPDFTDAIEYSINTPGLTCYEKLKEKAGGFGGSDPKRTYLRVTLGEDRGNSPGVPYVLEIWPSGHYSPIHKHSDSFGIIKVLYNEIQSRYFSGLQSKDRKFYHEVTFKEGEITWISDKFYQTHQLWNRTRKVCATIQCYQYGDKNRDHYEFFDYIDNQNIVKQFRPNTDWPFTEFKKLIKEEWDRYKYLSDELKNDNQ